MYSTITRQKRHITVDVYTVNIHNTESGIEPAKLSLTRYPSIEKFCADAGYHRSFVLDMDEVLGIGIDIITEIVFIWNFLTISWKAYKRLERWFYGLFNKKFLASEIFIAVVYIFAFITGILGWLLYFITKFLLFIMLFVIRRPLTKVITN